jgi:cytoskeleton-associated protein 5
MNIQRKVSERIVCWQDRIRAQLREIMRLAQRVFPAPRLVEFISQGLSSKSSRTRVECTEALSHILKTEGLAAFERSKEKPFPVIAQVVPSPEPPTMTSSSNSLGTGVLSTESVHGCIVVCFCNPD